MSVKCQKLSRIIWMAPPTILVVKLKRFDWFNKKFHSNQESFANRSSEKMELGTKNFLTFVHSIVFFSAKKLKFAFNGQTQLGPFNLFPRLQISLIKLFKSAFINLFSFDKLAQSILIQRLNEQLKMLCTP